jgi:dTDP-4-dehydrorhamnose 3,5-epimerase
MNFIDTGIAGAWQIDPERLVDDRGFFARVWSDDDAIRHGLNPVILQCNVSFNQHAGTLRGMHYQRTPHAEAKLVRCTTGAVFDVVVDLRPDSPTFKRWFGAELTATNHRMLYVPEGCAHGYLTLVDGAEVTYQVSAKYAPEAAGGVRWNDPAFGIAWPHPVRHLHPRDRDYPDFAG